MTMYHLIRRTRGPAARRRRLLVVGVLLVAGALTVTVVTGGEDPAGSSRAGPTVTAEPRDLATTLEASGSLQRSDEHLVAHASAVPTDGGGDGDSLPIEPVSYVPEPDTTSPPSSTPTSSTTTNPCSPTSTSTTSTSTSSTTMTTSCPPTPTTTSTTSTTTPTTPPDGDDGDGPPPADEGAPDGGDAAGPTDGPDDGGGQTAPAGGDGGSPTAPAGGDGDDGGGDLPSATLTGLLDVGATADQGTVLYTADQQPVVALTGDLPAWRTLKEGVDDGADVRQLEENLVALGYGNGLDVDETFTPDTAAAVEAWESDLGRAAPDGAVTVGDVVFLTTRGDVLGHEASVGDTLDAGTPVLTIGSEQRIVVADVDATDAGGWIPGSTVGIEWADGTTTQGTVMGTGKDVTDGRVELTVAVGTGDAGAGQRRSGAEATVILVDARRDDVIAVPVASIIDDDGSPAVRLVQSDGPDRTVPVETGLVANGWIEITAGLHRGEEIRLPG